MNNRACTGIERPNFFMLSDFLLFLAFILVLIGLGVLGFTIPPRPFRSHPAPSHLSEPLEFRPDLPEPVRLHFARTIGTLAAGQVRPEGFCDMPSDFPPAAETAPLIESAVVWGKGRAFIRGVWLPHRFKAWYRPGESYYRRMEITWYQRPVVRAIDKYINGEGLFQMGDRVERDERIDQNQLLTLWAETVWMPSVFVHHPIIRWSPVDEHTARLEVPFGENYDSLLAHFDPETGCMTHLSANRFPQDTDTKEPWRIDLMMWKSFHGMLIPCRVAVAWGESGSPWSYWNVDGIAYNVNVADQLGD
jgi:hypothetical protein